jgi:hypothetical protein
VERRPEPARLVAQLDRVVNLTIEHNVASFHSCPSLVVAAWRQVDDRKALMAEYHRTVG